MFLALDVVEFIHKCAVMSVKFIVVVKYVFYELTKLSPRNDGRFSIP